MVIVVLIWTTDTVGTKEGWRSLRVALVCLRAPPLASILSLGDVMHFHCFSHHHGVSHYVYIGSSVLIPVHEWSYVIFCLKPFNGFPFSSG